MGNNESSDLVLPATGLPGTGSLPGLTSLPGLGGTLPIFGG
jgi:hypothetical protein